MIQTKRIAHITLIVLTGFLATTALLGGISLLAGIYAPPVEDLQGTIFKDYTIPGLSLFLIVGGSALLATLFLIRKSRFGILFATGAGIMIMFFEFVEVLAIGSPPGAAQTLQIIYYGLGFIITIASIGIWFIELLLEPN